MDYPRLTFSYSRTFFSRGLAQPELSHGVFRSRYFILRFRANGAFTRYVWAYNWVSGTFGVARQGQQRSKVRTEHQSWSSFNTSQKAATAQMVEELYSFTKTFSDQIVSNMHKSLDGCCELPYLEKIFSCIQTTTDGQLQKLEAVKTPYRQENYFTANFGLVHAREISLGGSLAFRGSKRGAVTKSHVMFHVSIAETLMSLSNDASFTRILEDSERRLQNKEYFSAFHDGSVYEKHPLLQKERCLPIVLYYDDIEVCNPLGSYTKKHKLALFYFTLTDIPAQYRSRLQSIFLLGVAYSADVKEFGIDAILKPFFDEIHMLSNVGLKLDVGGIKKVFKVCMAMFCADTLAAHQVTGFKEGVGFSFRKCRHCTCTFEDMNKFFYDEFTARNREWHKSQAASGCSVQTGINRLGKIIEVPYFNIFDGVPQDVMHVLLEGCIPYTLKEVLRHFVGSNKKCFDMDQLNYQIMHFPYTYSDMRDKPSVINAQHLSEARGIRQSASQMWTLARLLPLMLMEYVDSSDEVWQCFLHNSSGDYKFGDVTQNQCG